MGMARLIDADAMKHKVCETCNSLCSDEPCEPSECYPMEFIDKLPTIDALKLPCRIGDKVWVIRNFKGFPHPQEGIVSEMYFFEDMKLCVVVKHIARGEWGKVVFATREEAEKAIEERKDNG